MNAVRRQQIVVCTFSKSKKCTASFNTREEAIQRFKKKFILIIKRKKLANNGG
jgi:hypothetical protein